MGLAASGWGPGGGEACRREDGRLQADEGERLRGRTQEGGSNPGLGGLQEVLTLSLLGTDDTEREGGLAWRGRMRKTGAHDETAMEVKHKNNKAE